MSDLRLRSLTRMATYAIGDVQGCYRTLERLLDRFGFEPSRDRLWLAGDLVNRGPRSLEVLRWARGLGERLVTVLGNHDLHLLGRAWGVRRRKAGDTLDAVLAAADCEALVDWLRRRPLVHRDNGFLLVHAGLQPSWSGDHAEAAARELEARLRGAAGPRELAALAARGLPGWESCGSAAERRAVALQSFTLLRTCRRDGRLCREFSGPPDHAPQGCRPWFELPDRRSATLTVVCGHWARLGLRRQPGLLALDTGCAWGGALSAVRLEDNALFQQPFVD